MTSKYPGRVNESRGDGAYRRAISSPRFESNRTISHRRHVFETIKGARTRERTRHVEDRDHRGARPWLVGTYRVLHPKMAHAINLPHPHTLLSLGDIIVAVVCATGFPGK